MAITSSSTEENVLDQYNDNLLWDGNVTKAQAALEAIRWLLVNRPESLSRSGRNVNYSSLEAEQTRITEFLDRQTSPVKTGSKQGFRISKIRPGGTR